MADGGRADPGDGPRVPARRAGDAVRPLLDAGGYRIWDETDELAAQKETGFLTRPDWLGDALSGRMTQPVGRLVVLVGTEGNTPLARGEALRFSRDLADAVYAICPWAKPER